MEIRKSSTREVNGYLFCPNIYGPRLQDLLIFSSFAQGQTWHEMNILSISRAD
ncbi:hypothetical protein SDJN02_19341 [Cucurbita argyrosperma subsp. argyrosperma]|nr:hypothetical protein SDJN02_19341 [Cucurbita argyrosperma subsp. argyrosperma]